MSFENAPVTKGFIVCSALASILVGIFDVKHYFHLQFVPHISRHHQYWRLLTHNVAFLNSSDLFLGILLLYKVGIPVERQFGSVKYASFAMITLLLGTLLEFLALILFHSIGLNHLALGPSLLIFSILYQYSRIVPSVYSYRVFGFQLNNKSLNYLLAMQMAVSHFPGSFAEAATGVLTGQLYRSDLAGLNAYRLPPSVVQFSTNFFLPLIGSLRPPRRSNRALPDEYGGSTPTTPQSDEIITTAQSSEGSGIPRSRTTRSNDEGNPSSSVMREWVDELTGRAERANAGVRAPSDAEITQLSSMFPDLERDVIVGALQRSPNIEGAVETLLLSAR